MFQSSWVYRKGIGLQFTHHVISLCELPWGIRFLKMSVVGIEARKSRSFASRCSHLLRLLCRFSLGTWISLIMIATSWWLDIRLPAYSTVLPSAIWIHSVLQLRSTSLRTGPLWAIDTGLFKWAEASRSPSHISGGCTHLVLFGNCSVLIVQPESSLSLIIHVLVCQASFLFQSSGNIQKRLFQRFVKNIYSTFLVIQLHLEMLLVSDLPNTNILMWSVL